MERFMPETEKAVFLYADISVFDSFTAGFGPLYSFERSFERNYDVVTQWNL